MDRRPAGPVARDGPLETEPPGPQPPKPRGLALRQRLLTSLETESRFEGCVERLAACLQSSEAMARTVIAEIDREAGWVDKGIPGHRVKAVQGGALAESDSIGLVRIEPGYAYPPHHHAEAELAFCMQGRADLLDGPLLHPGDYWVVPARTLHGCRSIGEQDCIVLLRRQTGLG